MPATSTDRLNGLTTSVALKAPVRAVTSANITLSGLQTIGGVALAERDRVLVKSQSTTTENGIYEASTSDWSRTADFDGNRDVVKGTLVVTDGVSTALLFYRVTTANPIVIGTSSITFEQASEVQDSFPETLSETDALVTPVSTGYRPGDFRRYGAVGDGVADDSTAISNAHKTGHRMLGGGSEFTYLCNSPITLTRSLDLDLEGATLKPNGNTQLFVRNSVTATASTTISSGYTIGSRSFVVASATGLAVGQWARITAENTPTVDTSAYPSHWAKLTSIVGTTVTIDTPFKIDYAGTVSLDAFTTAQIFATLKVRNGIFDGSACTNNTATGQAIRAYCFESVDIDAEFNNWDNGGTNTCALEIAQCIDVRVRIRAVGGDSQFQMADIQDCRTGSLRDSVVDGSHFGFAISRCMSAVAHGNHLNGRHKQEADDSVSPAHSVRGIKLYGCGTARVTNNECVDYESPIKVESCHQFRVTDNTVRNAGLSTFSGQIAMNIGNQVNGDITMNGIVAHNTVINCGGTGIGVTSDASYGRVIVIGNQVKGCGAYGIYCAVRNVTIASNRVENWNLEASAYNAIYYDDGATVIGNRFNHSTEATSVCLRSNFATNFKYTFNDNICESANPMFTGSLDVQSNGQTTIASGATTQTITHGLIRTPEVTDILITPANSPTNDPGHFWVDTITSTQFRLSVRADPGAGGAIFGYRCILKQPFTVV